VGSAPTLDAFVGPPIDAAAAGVSWTGASSELCARR
jgi:hypothetical protein